MRTNSRGQGKGSSPRVRGKPSVFGVLVQGLGLIPACAGKTGRFSLSQTAVAAHPRVCGENQKPRVSNEPYQGSSPRVRGKRFARPIINLPRRLIPACAGKTAAYLLLPVRDGAHPRVCGENIVARSKFKRHQGSSPRVRGKPRARRLSVRAFRLIPACAGKTSLPAFVTFSPEAHPRVCGENGLGAGQEPKTAGSSPRVRGKLRANRLAARLLRLIPACAGKTRHIWIRAGLRPAHPRVCGENRLGHAGLSAAAGSSPRVRGKPLDAERKPGGFGLIPACAGKTEDPDG